MNHIRFPSSANELYVCQAFSVSKLIPSAFFMTAVMIVLEGTDGTHCATGHGSWYCSG